LKAGAALLRFLNASGAFKGALWSLRGRVWKVSLEALKHLFLNIFDVGELAPMSHICTVWSFPSVMDRTQIQKSGPSTHPLKLGTRFHARSCS
jgi:hypothetical protein